MTKFPALIILISLLAGRQLCSGQDTITFRNHSTISVKITELGLRTIKYRMPGYEDGPVVVIKNRKVRQIDFGNGSTDMMGYQNPRTSRPLGICAGYAAELTSGGALFSATADYFINPWFDLEMSLGTSDLSGRVYYSAGSRIHFVTRNSEHRLSPFAGVLGGQYYGDAIVQFPAGVSYLAAMGINASLSLNEMISFSGWQATFIELRIGWRFSL